MKTRWIGLTATVAFMAVAAGANAQAENGLLGIKLFDSGVRIVSVFGSPDSIEPVTVGITSMGGGGMGGGMGGPGMGGPGMGGGGGPSGPPQRPNKPMLNPGAGFNGPDFSGFSFGDSLLKQRGPMFPGPGGMGGQGGPPPGFGGPSGSGGFGGPPGGGFGQGGGGSAPGLGGGSAQNVTYTRWIYNRHGSRYGFILDKSGRVVQIEAIGLGNPHVKTRRGVTFGNTFADVVHKYGMPDGYDIAGDNILVRYLNKDRAAFRFSRVGAKKPEVVTGVVIAAGKG